MKVDTRLLLAAFLLSACGDSDDGSIRSSKNIPTEKMEFRVAADVHTHLGMQGAPDETHTTLSVELFGEDADGYYYNIELGDTDQLSVEVNGETTPLRASNYPSDSLRLGVIYYEDFLETAANAEFKVTLNRTARATAASVSVALLDDAGFMVSPVDEAIPFSQLLTLAWEEKEGNEYQLIFQLICEGSDGKVYSSKVGFPNTNVSSISSPFTFNPVNFFNRPDPDKMTGCKLHSSLISAKREVAPVGPPFKFTAVRSTRQHHSEKVVTLN